MRNDWKGNLYPPGPPQLAEIHRPALFLDLDGTLAAIVAKPGDTIIDSRRNRLLALLGKRLDGRLAIVSGRTIAEVDRILEASVAAVAGVHGLERRTAAGAWLTTHPHPRLAEVRAILEALAQTRDGLLVEDKGLSVALHYRGAPEAEASIRELGKELASHTGLVVQQGSLVIELRTPGPDKGDAIEAFMSEPPFAGSQPLFFGDDLTDEHGFAVVERMGGTGILVGTPRQTEASRQIPNVESVLDWLQAGVGADVI